MIEVSETTAFMIYLCITLGPLLGIWLFQHYARRHKKVDMTSQQLFVCEYCHFCYLDQVSKPITRCPQCQSYNHTNDKRP